MSVVFTVASRKPDPPPDPVRCPNCSQTITESLGPVNSSLEWFRCVLCRHIWVQRPPHAND
jgi:hypothetical protein